MSLPFLKISPEEAVTKIQDMILAGYQLKDAINNEHEQARIAGGSALVDAALNWSQRFNVWIKESIAKLNDIYESQVYAYNFRDATPAAGAAMVGNVTRSNVVLGVQSRIERLNEYEKFIRGHVPIEINAGRDIYLINGDGADVRTRN